MAIWSDPVVHTHQVIVLIKAKKIVSRTYGLKLNTSIFCQLGFQVVGMRSVKPSNWEATITMVTMAPMDRITNWMTSVMSTAFNPPTVVYTMVIIPRMTEIRRMTSSDQPIITTIDLEARKISSAIHRIRVVRKITDPIFRI